jgi:hypothetical protein
VTREQALAAGLSDTQLRYRIETGRWERRRYGVYALTAAPQTWQQDVLAACLSAKRPVFAGGRTAATLWGLTGVHPGRGIQLVSQHQVRAVGLRVARSRHLPPDHVTTVQSIPVLTPSRTLFDLASVLPVRVLESAVDEAIRTGLTDLFGLRRCVEVLAGARLPGAGRLRDVLAGRLPTDAPPGSVLERQALRILKRAGLPAPMTQYAVPFPDRTYHLDFAWPKARLALEVDGWGGHRLRGRFDRDRVRINRLQATGWLVLHYTSRMEAEELVTAVRRALARRACKIE